MPELLRIALNLLTVGIFVKLITYYNKTDGLEIDREKLRISLMTCLLSAFLLRTAEQVILVTLVFNAYTDTFDMKVYLGVIEAQVVFAVAYTIISGIRNGFNIPFIIVTVTVSILPWLCRAYAMGDAMMVLSASLVLGKRVQLDDLVSAYILAGAIIVLLIRWIIVNSARKSQGKERLKRIDFSIGIAISYLAVGLFM